MDATPDSQQDITGQMQDEAPMDATPDSQQQITGPMHDEAPSSFEVKRPEVERLMPGQMHDEAPSSSEVKRLEVERLMRLAMAKKHHQRCLPGVGNIEEYPSVMLAILAVQVSQP